MLDLSCLITGNAKNTIRFLGWAIAWTLTMVLADQAILYEWHSSAAITITAIVVNAGLASA